METTFLPAAALPVPSSGLLELWTAALGLHMHTGDPQEHASKRWSCSLRKSAALAEFGPSTHTRGS